MQPTTLHTDTDSATATSAFLTVSDVVQVFPTPNGPFTVLDGIDLTVTEGEFICIIGHSGCGKSTLLNLVAGFGQPTKGDVRLQNRRIERPGPDRMMVFQNYSLLPWKTAFENVYLGVKSVFPEKSKAERTEIANEHLAMVGLTEAAHQKPHQLSGGMKQRVAIARALAIRPQVLILDEPFGALDAITKEELQEELIKIWQEHRLTVLMITHDIDEALFLADRLVMMTNGPAAKIGEIVDIPFARPRQRAQLIEDPQYRELRNYALDFLFNRFAHDEDDDDDPLDVKNNSANPFAQRWVQAVAAVGVAAALAIAGWGIARALVDGGGSTSEPVQTQSID
jgi:nitrate ABC transporter ATP-binding subunit